MFSASKTAGPSGYNLTNSLRFRASASAFLNRTPASTTNRQTWTWSSWVKRGTLGARQHIFVSANPVVNTGGQQEFQFCFDSSDRIEITGGTSGVGQDLNLTTTQVFRDPSAWYHFVVAIDTTQATSSNRMKFYVNGNQVTAFGTAIYPSQNYNTSVDLAGFSHRIGGSGGSYLDAYQDEINFIDGQALTPSSFGSTNATTGVWQPARYTGTYGTNGFYLNFTDIGLTSGSNTGLGRDFSGNGNFWNTNNISVTAGVTYDAMLDVPTLTSATVANYPVMNVLNKTSDVTLSNGNLTFASTGDQCTPSTMGMTSGKWYFEVTNTSGSSTSVGIMTAQADKSQYLGADTFGYAYWGYTVSYKMHNGSNVAYGGGAWSSGDVVGCYYDADNGTIGFTRNGTDYGNAYTGINTSNEWFFAVGYNGASCTLNINFGQRPFVYTPPTGFKALNAFNLPNSTVVKGNTVMDATLYSGNDTTNVIVNQAQFKPDLVWIKARNAISYHGLIDSVRGRASVLFSNATDSQGTSTSIQDLVSFNSNGFTLGDDAQFNCNTSGSNLVAWQWQAGQGTNTTNTAGSITSTVSVNATAGFSIVTYSGTNSASTIGHGLGVAPKMIFVKTRSGTENWNVYHTSIGNGSNGLIYLNLTNAAVTGVGTWNNTAPTSSVFSVTGNNLGVNQSGQTYVAYCWAEIAGFSRFGSYTGNASTDGPFIYLGFRPKFVMAKMSSGISNWYIRDTSRDTSNTAFRVLYPDTTDVEGSDSTFGFDLLSNGFKVRSSSNGANQSGQTFIYAAFSENPFKNALAR